MAALPPRYIGHVHLSNEPYYFQRTNSVFFSQQISEQYFQLWFFNPANRAIIVHSCVANKLGRPKPNHDWLARMRAYGNRNTWFQTSRMAFAVSSVMTKAAVVHVAWLWSIIQVYKEREAKESWHHVGLRRNLTHADVYAKILWEKTLFHD